MIGLKEMINRIPQLNISQLENSFNSHLEKQFTLVLPNQPNSPCQLMIERENLWPKENLVLQIERGNLWKEARTKCKKMALSHRDDADKFNLVIDAANIDFNISGVPNAMVKRSHDKNVHNLIQQIENHPQREKHFKVISINIVRSIFSAKSQKMRLWLLGTLNHARSIDVEPKSQCRACLTHWSAGIVCCTCGHLMKDDTTENKKYISSVLDLFSIPAPHGKSTSKEVSQEEMWQHPRPIHPRQVLQKNDDRVGSLWGDHPWDGSACKRRPQSYCHKRRKWRLTWQLVDLLKRGEFRYDADKASTWLQESIVHIVPPKKTDQEALWKVVIKFLLMVAMTNELVGTRPLIERGNLCTQWATVHLRYESQQQLNAKFIVNISVTADSSLLSPTGGVKRIPPNTAIHEQMATKMTT